MLSPLWFSRVVNIGRWLFLASVNRCLGRHLKKKSQNISHILSLLCYNESFVPTTLTHFNQKEKEPLSNILLTNILHTFKAPLKIPQTHDQKKKKELKIPPPRWRTQNRIPNFRIAKFFSCHRVLNYSTSSCNQVNHRPYL